MSRLHVVFDLDDTLYPERQFAVSGFRAAGAWAHAELGLANLAEDMIRLLDAGHLGRLFGLVLEERMPGHHPDHVKALISAYRNAEPDLALFDDAAWALEHYAGHGPLGLITDGTLAMQRKKVQALALEPRFREIVYTDALGEARAYFKPHPMAYEVIEKALGTLATASSTSATTRRRTSSRPTRAVGSRCRWSATAASTTRRASPPAASRSTPSHRSTSCPA